MKKTLWLLIAPRAHAEIHAVAPTLAWMAEEADAEFEMYLEDERDGRLFARSGSTVLGGRHFQQFNYLHAACDVKYVLLGGTELLRSSIDTFGGEILAEANSARDLYAQLGAPPDSEEINVPAEPPGAGKPDLRPYFYQEIFFRRGLGVPEGASPDEDIRECTVKMAERWIDRAAGVAFGDPDAVLSMIATLCREKRVCVFGPRVHLPPEDIVCNAYAEETSSAAADVRRLAEKAGNRVILGRQTCDGDLFEWSKSGIGIKIMDPNRPAFPVVDRIEHRWSNRRETVFDTEPDDATLEKWADERKVLAAMLVHSGEMAHNEAMLNLVELCAITGLKLGIGVHAARYETCPQEWELISVPLERGGALGLVEPVLHCGGMGVLTENTCPPERLAEHCRSALQRIAEIAGEAWRPRGYLAFMDSDMPAFKQTLPAIYKSIEATGLTYTVSSAQPGRNRILNPGENHLVLNQSSRCICAGSPYVRVTTADDLRVNTPVTSPGWWLGVIDAPVVSFNPYIWRKGNQFMEIVDWLTQGPWINVTPNVVARYARILQTRGLIPAGT